MKQWNGANLTNNIGFQYVKSTLCAQTRLHGEEMPSLRKFAISY